VLGRTSRAAKVFLSCLSSRVLRKTFRPHTRSNRGGRRASVCPRGAQLVRQITTKARPKVRHPKVHHPKAHRSRTSGNAMDGDRRPRRDKTPGPERKRAHTGMQRRRRTGLPSTAMMRQSQRRSERRPQVLLRPIPILLHASLPHASPSHARASPRTETEPVQKTEHSLLRLRTAGLQGQSTRAG
jgi:hypothetical protein